MAALPLPILLDWQEIVVEVDRDPHSGAIKFNLARNPIGHLKFMLQGTSLFYNNRRVVVLVPMLVLLFVNFITPFGRSQWVLAYIPTPSFKVLLVRHVSFGLATFVKGKSMMPRNWPDYYNHSQFYSVFGKHVWILWRDCVSHTVIMPF